MGLILVPIFLLAASLVIINSFLINRLHEKEQLSNKIFLYGFSITIFIFSLILLSYHLEGRIYGLSPYFRIPIFMFILPSFIGYIGLSAQTSTLKTITESFLASTLISGILVLVLNYQIINLIDSLGLEKYY